MRWYTTLFLLMPDHLHAVLSFARDKSMSELIRDWKRLHKRTNHVIWQEQYFDHRLQADERGPQLSAKLNYIRQNPVAHRCVYKDGKTGPGLLISTERGIVLSSRRCQLSRRTRKISGGEAAASGNALRTTHSTVKLDWLCAFSNAFACSSTVGGELANSLREFPP